MSSADCTCTALMGGRSSVGGCGQVFSGLPYAFGDARTVGARIESLHGGAAGEVEETAWAVEGIAVRLRICRRVERGQRAGVDLLDEPREAASNAWEGPRHQRRRSAPHVGAGALQVGRGEPGVGDIADDSPAVATTPTIELTGEHRQGQLGLVIRRPRTVALRRLQVVEIDLPVARSNA